MASKSTVATSLKCMFIILSTVCAFTDAGNVLRISPIVRNSSDSSSLRYENYDEDALPLLSKDLTLIRQAVDAIEDDACRSQCRQTVEGLQNLTTWAVKFYDSSSKIPEGLLAGSVYQFGNFDECLGIGVEDDAPQGVRGQYCLTKVHVAVPESYASKRASVWEAFEDPQERYEQRKNVLYWGICVPSACSPQTVDEVVKGIVRVAFSGSRLKLTTRVLENSCFKDQPPVVDAYDVTYLCVVLFIISLVVAATILDAMYLKRKSGLPTGKLSQILLAFSFISNAKKLLGPVKKNDLNLDCISGIKAVSMFCIVGGHALIFAISGPVMDTKFVEQCIAKVVSSVFVNNPLLVDTFLVLSGFLFSRVLLHELEKTKSVNVWLLYVVRYIRLTPTYVVVIGLYATWLTKIGTGPLWSRMQLEKERCLSSWWTNLLYINNYVDTRNLCMFQSWYLSVDTQLYILAPAIIYPLWKWRRFGEYLLAVVTMIAVVIPFVITLAKNMDPTLMIYLPEINDLSSNEYFITSYIKTHMRAGAYCIGIIFGYVLHRMHTSDYRLSKIAVRIGWVCGTLSLVISMCSISIFYGPRIHYTALEAAFYAALHRALWSFGTGWVLLACITDNSGPINNVLKWRFFVPLGRLQYSAYLVNGLVELYSYSRLRSPQSVDVFQVTNVILSHWLLTLGIAFLLSTFLESPILAIERMIFQRGKKQRVTKSEEDANTART